MTLPYNAAGVDTDTVAQPTSPSPSGQDVVPSAERGEDERRSAIDHDLTTLPSRPLTHDEQQAAEHDNPPAERVYAPASARVAKPPVPGHRDMIEHTDPSTPERRAAGGSPGGRVRTSRGRRRVRIPSGSSAREQQRVRDQWLGIGVSWAALFACGAAGTWLYLRWQQEQNRPANRLRRQAERAAHEIRDHVPEVPEGSSTAMSLAAALLSTGLVVWRRLHTSRTEQSIEETFEPRLSGWLDRWLPHQVQAEASLKVRR